MPATRASKARRTAHSWVDLPDSDLLRLRFKDLHLKLEGTWLEDQLDQLNGELEWRGLTVAHGWLSDEWFSPHTTPGIAFPFYLAHPRLMRLERKMAMDVEGGKQRACMKILRHEAGHVVQRAYALHRRKRWQQLFGRSTDPYPKHYRPNPISKHFVQHLPRWYAQSHPDEDFAETFAVWMTPRSRWRTKYADWPVLEKLQYVDELMKEIADTKPLMTRRVDVDPIQRSMMTLGEHYKRKCERYAFDTPTRFDVGLIKIFADEGPSAATAFIRRNRQRIREAVSTKTGAYQLTLDAAIDDMIDRCRVLKLRTSGSDRKMRVDLTALLTTKAVQSLYSSSRRQSFAI